MRRLSRRGLHVRDYFWRELVCRARGHRTAHDLWGYRYCPRCGDTLPEVAATTSSFNHPREVIDRG